jgi:hypothetical protein
MVCLMREWIGLSRTMQLGIVDDSFEWRILRASGWPCPQTNSDPNRPSFEKYPDQGPYTGLGPPFWWTSFPSSRIANIVHDASASDLIPGLNKAIQYNAGLVFITGSTGSNPYGQLLLGPGGRRAQGGPRAFEPGGGGNLRAGRDRRPGYQASGPSRAGLSEAF